VGDWRLQDFEFIVGGPDAPLSERLLRGGLFVCTLIVLAQWLVLWGTRWGDHHRVAKSFVLSVLLHFCLGLGWVTFVRLNPMGSGLAAEPEPVSVNVTSWESTERERSESAAVGSSFADAPLPSPERMERDPVPHDDVAVERTSTPKAVAQFDPPSAWQLPPADPAPPQPAIPQTRLESVRAAITVPQEDDSRPERAPAPATNRFERSATTATRTPSRLPEPVATRRIASDFNSDRIPEAAETLSSLGSPTIESPSTSIRMSVPATRGSQRAQTPLGDLEEVRPTTGILRGVVWDLETERILPGATIRLELARGKPIIATTDSKGRYELSLPETPESFAITATHANYLPEARNLRSDDVRGKTRQLNFALRAPRDNVIPLEANPVIHHLGNDQFHGTENSKFQRASEGAELTLRFQVAARQIQEAGPAATVTFLAKGIQCEPVIRLNGHRLDTRKAFSPADGSYAPIELPLNPAWLANGANTLTIRSVDCTGDLDDFEFVNLQIRLPKPGPVIEPR